MICSRPAALLGAPAALCVLALGLGGCALNEGQSASRDTLSNGATECVGQGELPPPEAYLRPEDQEKARCYRLDDLPCTVERVENGITTISGPPTDECYRMLPRQRYSGVWVNEFEGSRFYPGRSTRPDNRDEVRIWLDVERVNPATVYGLAYQIEFEGRRTMYPGPTGHLGSADHELIVDRMISITPIDERPVRQK